MAELLLRPANDSIRPLSVVEVELRVRPAPVLAGMPPRWRLDPQYGAWMAREFPAARFLLCPLPRYKREVEAADARLTMEQLAAQLDAAGAATAGYVLEGADRRIRSSPFAIGSRSARALVEFLFAWG